MRKVLFFPQWGKRRSPGVGRKVIYYQYYAIKHSCLKFLSPASREEGAARPLAPAVGGRLGAASKHYDVDRPIRRTPLKANPHALSNRGSYRARHYGRRQTASDHLEAVDHYDAVLWMRDLASATTPVDENVVCELHRRIVARSQPEIAGIYSRNPRRIAGSPVIFPNPAKIPQLMEEFSAWLKTAPPEPASAFEAHYRLTAIHPFGDGNGRTARLLMNFFADPWRLPAGCGTSRRSQSLSRQPRTGSLAKDFVPYQTLMHGRLDFDLGEGL